MTLLTDSLSPKEILQEAIARAIYWAEADVVPDRVTRFGIRRLLKSRLFALNANNIEQVALHKQAFIRAMNHSPVAVQTEAANTQHYELPAAFFDKVLGTQRKYSCGYWEDSTASLDEAEENALSLSCAHADLQDGQDILELGCGWGSLSLYMARHYPTSRITAVSNSHSQREFICKQADQLGLHNLTVITADMRSFNSQESYDRVVSIEMFEHMRNYQELYKRIHRWLRPGGKFFMHIFCHRDVPYMFEVQDKSDWMSQYFFSGGMMPSDDLPKHFQRHLRLEDQWRWNGDHYAKTANAWLKKMDDQKAAIRNLFINTYGESDADMWRARWRIFFMACAELFAYNQGNEWYVSHYLFRKPDYTQTKTQRAHPFFETAPLGS